jgi:predicted RNase H-like HicB family nuclease
MSNVFSIIVTQEDDMFVAVNPDTDIVSQGATIDEALANVHEALELYLEEAGNSRAAVVPKPTLLTTVTV